MPFVPDEPQKASGSFVPDQLPSQFQPPLAPQQMNQLQARMGIRGMRSGQGTDTLLPNIGSAIGSAGYDVGGSVTDLTGSPALGTAANVATEALPMAIGGGLGAVSKLPEAAQGAGRWLMGKALKPSGAEWISGKGERAVETLLREGYNPTKGGVRAMRGEVKALGSEAENILAPSAKELDKEAVIANLLPNYEKALVGGDVAGDVSILSREAQNFRARPGLGGHDTIPIQLAQDIKQQMGRELGSTSYGVGLKPEAERDARKALVNALKEGIAKAEPAVAPLNARQSDFINAIKIAERRSAVQGNTNPAGLALIANDPMAGIGFLADKSSAFKAALARLLYSQSPAAGAPAGRLAGQLAGALSGTSPEE